MMTLLKHQQYARERYANESYAPLFFDVGTGKSITALALIADRYARGEIDAAMIVAPNNIDVQWARQEIPKFIAQVVPTVPEWGDIDTMVYNNKKSKKSIPFVENKLNICCVNIDQFSTVTTYLRYVEWCNAHRTAIVLDESTKIGNPKAKRTERLLYEFNNIVKRGRSIIKSEPRSPFRAILTGSAFDRGPFALWSMYEFCKPGRFGLNYYAFCNKYGMYHTIDVNGRMIRILITEESWKQIKSCSTYDLANMMYGVTLSTYTVIQMQDHFEGAYKGLEDLRKDVERDAMVVRITDITDMPERIFIKKLIPMSADQSKVYHSMEADLVAQYKDKETSATTKLTMYIRLQQIASGFISSMADMPPAPKLFEPKQCDYWQKWNAYEHCIADYKTEALEKLIASIPTSDPYLEYVKSEYDKWMKECNDYLEDPPPASITWFDDKPKLDMMLEDIEEAGDQPILIVTHFSAEADMIFNTLVEKGYKVGLQTGWKRVGSLFKYSGYEGQNAGTPEYNIMVANIACIGMGFNLQKGSLILFYSNTFSYEDRNQVCGRIFRIGQRNKCRYIDYITEDTIDMKIYASLQAKKNVSEYLRDKTAEQCLLQWDTECKEAFEDVVF